MIHTGACCWTDEHECLECNIPKGIELKVEKAKRTGSFLPFDKPWEDGNPAWIQVMEDDGLYRMWYSMSRQGPPREDFLMYAESDDGMNWRKPKLGIHDIDGSSANNVVLTGFRGANHSHVMKDPTGSGGTKYRCWSFESWWQGKDGERLDDDEGMRRLNANNAAKEGDERLPVELKGVMIGFNSPDGLHWTKLDDPILEEWHDTHNICRYDEVRGKYVGYFRGFYGGRRAVSFAETDDFEHWPPTKTIHHHVADDEPDVSLYSNCYTPYPGNPGIHLMFPGMYHQGDDHVDGQLAVSTDGVNWSRFTRQPIISNIRDDGKVEGSLYPEPDLLRFPKEGVFRLPCRAGDHYHNEWYNDNLKRAALDAHDGYMEWAEWTEDRLAGICAEQDGQFTTNMMACGDRMIANFRAEPDGWIKFELIDRIVWPPIPTDGVDGCTFADADLLTGDETHAAVSWKGSPDLSKLKGKSVGVRVKLHKATLFSLTMYGADDPLAQKDPRFPV